MLITNIHSKKIEACCHIQYKGYDIDIQTFFTPFDIDILKDNIEIAEEVSSLEEAISIIEKHIKEN